MLGLRIPKVVISMQPIEAMMLAYTGMESLLNLKSHMKNGYASAWLHASIGCSDGASI